MQKKNEHSIFQRQKDKQKYKSALPLGFSVFSNIRGLVFFTMFIALKKEKRKYYYQSLSPAKKYVRCLRPVHLFQTGEHSDDNSVGGRATAKMLQTWKPHAGTMFFFNKLLYLVGLCARKRTERFLSSFISRRKEKQLRMKKTNFIGHSLHTACPCTWVFPACLSFTVTKTEKAS